MSDELDLVERPADDGDDVAERYWLLVVRDGDVKEKVAGRAKLADIYERRGRYDAAISLLLANLQDGEPSGEILERLNRLSRARGQGDDC